MKQLFNHLLLLLLLVAIVLCTGCKTRKVDIQTSHTVDKSIETRVIKADSSFIDTGKIFQRFKDSVTTKDSYEALIMTDTGLVYLVNGSFTGHAKSITIKGTHARDSLSIKNTANFKGSTGIVNISDSANNKKDIITDTKQKHITAKADNGWVLWLIGLIALILVVLYIFHIFKL